MASRTCGAAILPVPPSCTRASVCFSVGFFSVLSMALDLRQPTLALSPSAPSLAALCETNPKTENNEYLLLNGENVPPTMPRHSNKRKTQLHIHMRRMLQARVCADSQTCSSSPLINLTLSHSPRRLQNSPHHINQSLNFFASTVHSVPKHTRKKANTQAKPLTANL
jgi:hypothetical protein